MDSWGEFFDTELSEFLGSKGCIHQSSCPYTPEENGVVQRKLARALLLQGNLPKVFWGDNVLTNTHILN